MDTEDLHPDAAGLQERPPAEIARLFAAEARTVARAVEEATGPLARAIEAAEAALSAGGRVLLCGAGTSGRLAAQQAAEVPPTFGLDPDRVRAIVAGGPGALARAREGREDDRTAGRRTVEEAGVGPPDLLCAISASGRTPFVRAALETAREAGARTVLVTAAAPAGDPADVVCRTSTGPEVVAGSTRLKAATAAKVCLDAITTGALARRGRVMDGWMVGVVPRNEKLRRRARRMIAALGEVDPDRAGELLDEADGAPDVAVVMARTGLGPAEARARLDEVDGDVPAACGRP